MNARLGIYRAHLLSKGRCVELKNVMLSTCYCLDVGDHQWFMYGWILLDQVFPSSHVQVYTHVLFEL